MAASGGYPGWALGRAGDGRDGRDVKHEAEGGLALLLAFLACGLNLVHYVLS